MNPNNNHKNPANQPIPDIEVFNRPSKFKDFTKRNWVEIGILIILIVFCWKLIATNTELREEVNWYQDNREEFCLGSELDYTEFCGLEFSTPLIYDGKEYYAEFGGVRYYPRVN